MFSTMMAPGTFIYDLNTTLNHTQKIENLKEQMRNETPVRKAPTIYGHDLGHLMADMLSYAPEKRPSMN